MKIKVIKSGSMAALPVDIIFPLIPESSSVQLKVLLYMLSSPDFNEDTLCDTLNITKKSFEDALVFWVENNIISIPKASKTTSAKDCGKANVIKKHSAIVRSSELPRYSSDEISEYFEKHSSIQNLLINCQQIMGKMFNQAETEILVGLCDYLKLEDEYILLLFSHCAKMGKKSLRYIETLAVSLFDRGILAYDELDAHLNSLEALHKSESSLRSLFGIGRRALTKKEKECFEMWIGKWKFPLDIIEKAFEITVENTGSASVPYCSAILKSWNDCGYTTLEQIESAIIEYKHDKESAVDKKGSFDTDDFFEAALRRSYGDNADNYEN